MFRIDQIITATTFIRCFRGIAERLAQHMEPLLIAQKNGRFLVVMDGEFFEGLVGARDHVASVADREEGAVQSDFKS